MKVFPHVVIKTCVSVLGKKYLRVSATVVA